MTVKSGRVRCFFDLELDGVPLGRVVFELFSDLCPITAENFRALCTGEKGLGQNTGKPLHYQHVKLHRVVKDFMIQGGDFSAGNGTGGESIYGGTFDDENFELEHDQPFLLSMANRGKNTNGSQFFLTTQPAPHLNGVHVVFGHVVSGQEVVTQVESVSTDNKSRPLQDVRIARCGELVLQTKQKEKKKKKKRDRSASSEAEERSKKKKKHDKKEKKAKKAKESEAPEEGEVAEEATEEPAGADHPLASTTKIDPDEIPPVPENRFLDRGGGRAGAGGDGGGESSRPREREREGEHRHRERRRSRTEIRAGKRIKGRGFLRYDPEMARSRSRTPPHWRVAQKRTIKLSDFERIKEQESRRAEELKTREEERQKRHAERDQQEQERRERRHKEREERHKRRAGRSGEDAERGGSAGHAGEEADVEDIHERLDYEDAAVDEQQAAAVDEDESADEDESGRRLLRLIQERQKRRLEALEFARETFELSQALELAW
ncbi:peptidyl-prolyl cis-trans isomerase G-like [Pollicipes pollicipes]|uniref:peptidyl-prolyl cis-trans isomerase G-like n=1 Tax=Pollicipes pollicipes TaxID=41117 RepID=UPI00188538C9|nr:peptidyl-prolyl cis-trans isomerase G-like [Pollicipes pollicipes]